MINNCYTEFYSGIFCDSRLDKRVGKILTDLVHSGSATVNKSVPDNASKIGFYRTLGNNRITHDNILEGSFRRCIENLDAEHVLCFNDTTELNFNHIATKLGKLDPDIGPTTDKKVAGMFCHPMLVCSEDGQTIFGISSTSIFNRKWDQKDKHERNYPNLSIEEKESYRWIENAQNTRQRISNNVIITIIGDRESDIYEEYVRIASDNTHLLIRARSDRRTESENGKLYADLSAQPCAGKITIELQANKSRTKREADIEVRYCEVEITAPQRYKGPIKSKKLYAIEAREITPCLQKDQSPVLWRLLTTHTVETLQQALQCIQWYKQRWLIEELFRVMKTKGFQIESSQLGRGAGIKKLVALVLESALQVMRMKLALDGQHLHTAELIFSKKQILFLSILLKTVEGKTEKQKNPYPEKTIAWAAWIIARLGKWTGYKAHGPPGYMTIKNGFETFNIQYKIFEILNEG